MLPKWLDAKTIIVLCTIIGTAFVANYRLGQIEKGQTKFSIKIASVETDIQSLKLRIVGIENDVESNAEKLAERKHFMLTVEKSLEQHGAALIRQGMSLEQQSKTLEKILKKLE